MPPTQKKAEKERRTYADFLALLNDIVRVALEAEDLQTLLKVLADRTGELFSADDCFITLWDEANKVTIPAVAYGSMSQTYSQVPAKPGERTLTSSTLEAGHALVVENIANTPYVDPDVAVPFPHLRTALGLPLISGEKKLGAAILGFRHRRRFTQEEIGRGEMAARQISLAMSKVLLLEEARRRVYELTSMHAILQTFTLQGDTHQTFGLLTKNLASLFGAQMCTIALYDPASGEIQAQLPTFGLNNEQAAAFHYPASAGAEIWHFSQAGVFRANLPEEIPDFFKPYAQSCGVETVLAAPFWDAKHELIGAILTINKPGGFSDDDVRLIEILASQVTVVVENTHLLTAERRRAEELSVLHEIAAAATESQDEDELIERVTFLIGERLYPDNFGVLLLDEEKRELYLHSSYRLGEREMPIRIPLDRGITGSVARSGKHRCVNDVRLAPEYVNADARIQSELCAPLKVGERVLGVINAESAKLYAFTKDDENLIGIMASQLATAIQQLRTAEAEHRQTTQLARSNVLIKVLAQVGARATAASDPEGVMQTLGSELSKIGLTCLITLPDLDGQNMAFAYISAPTRVIKLVERAAERKMRDFLIPRERLLLFSDKNPEPALLHDPITIASNILVDFPKKIIEMILRLIGVTEDMPLCHLPLVAEGNLQGVLWLWGKDLRESDLPTMSIFANQVAIALQNANLLTEVRRLAITDDLTGIFNRRHFFDLAEREFARAHRYHQPLSALILDVDHFKKFNDEYGHHIGDQVLRQVARRMQVSLRESDILGRYGGEEFSILLPVTDLKAGVNAAERLHSQVTSTPIETEAGMLTVRLSIGVATTGMETSTLQDLIKQADQAMYLAKDAGRNRVATK